jgi:hypothetical protein
MSRGMDYSYGKIPAPFSFFVELNYQASLVFFVIDAPPAFNFTAD